MKVVDHEPHSWFLFEENHSLLLDVNCNHSAFGYTYMIKLSPEETIEYKALGNEYLNKLANDIQYSAPILKNSNSIHKGRDVSQKYSKKSLAAITKWRKKNNNG